MTKPNSHNDLFSVLYAGAAPAAENGATVHEWGWGWGWGILVGSQWRKLRYTQAVRRKWRARHADAAVRASYERNFTATCRGTSYSEGSTLIIAVEVSWNEP